MNLIFFCYGGAHTSVTAANLYLGRLPRHRRATFREIVAQPQFDAAAHRNLGRPAFLGHDVAGRRVYCLGLGAGQCRLAQGLMDFAGLLGASRNDLALCFALSAATWPMRIGGFLSRRLGLVTLGRPLVAWGAVLAYPHFVALVREAEVALAAHGGPANPWVCPVDAPAPVPDNRQDSTECAPLSEQGGIHHPLLRAGTEDGNGQGAEPRDPGGVAG